MKKMLRLMMSLCVCLSLVEAVRNTSYDFDGVWYNELGSCMELTQSTSDRLLNGTYLSPKASGGAPARGRVVGQYKRDDDTFSFSVTWYNYLSTTGWAGEYKVTEEGKPVLFTTWLLVSATPSIGDIWMNTLVGQDEFTRNPQVQNDCAKLLTGE